MDLLIAGVIHTTYLLQRLYQEIKWSLDTERLRLELKLLMERGFGLPFGCFLQVGLGLAMVKLILWSSGVQTILQITQLGLPILGLALAQVRIIASTTIAPMVITRMIFTFTQLFGKKTILHGL